MAKEIERSEKPDFFASGGKTKMFGKGTAHSAVPDTSGKPSNSGTAGSEAADRPYEAEDYTKGVRYSEGGGSDEMFGKGHAGKKEPGISGKADQSG